MGGVGGVGGWGGWGGCNNLIFPKYILQSLQLPLELIKQFTVVRVFPKKIRLKFSESKTVLFKPCKFKIKPRTSVKEMNYRYKANMLLCEFS